MKKVLLSIALIFSIFGLVGCENSTNLRCATIREITSPGSEDYGVTVAFQEDERLNESAVDIQIKTNKICQLTFWEENSEKINIKIEKADTWNSLTSLIVIAKDKPDTERFMPFKEAISKTYIFNSSEPVEITFRVVAGDAEKNSKETGEVLVGSEDISDEFKLKIQNVSKKD